MKKTNVLVTGGAGYIGAVLIPKLLNKNYQVTVLDSYLYNKHVFDKFKSHPRLSQIKGDIRNEKLVEKALESVHAVIHLAAISNDPSFDFNPKLGKSVNFDATVQLIDLAKKSGVKRFIFASSSSVYGVKKEKLVTEDLSLQPFTNYSKYKVMSERYLLNCGSANFTVLVLRPATVCGFSPRLRLDLTVNLLTIQALVNHKMTVFGGSQIRPNIHIDDITDLYVKALSYPATKVNGKTFNAGFENKSLMSIAKLIRHTLKDKTIKIETTPTRDLRSYKISSRKIARELGFRPKHTIADAITDLKSAYLHGKIPDALTNPKYYNIQTLKQLSVKC